jgi:hypothetical protein
MKEHKASYPSTLIHSSGPWKEVTAYLLGVGHHGARLFAKLTAFIFYFKQGFTFHSFFFNYLSIFLNAQRNDVPLTPFHCR